VTDQFPERRTWGCSGRISRVISCCPEVEQSEMPCWLEQHGEVGTWLGSCVPLPADTIEMYQYTQYSIGYVKICVHFIINVTLSENICHLHFKQFCLNCFWDKKYEAVLQVVLNFMSKKKSELSEAGLSPNNQRRATKQYSHCKRKVSCCFPIIDRIFHF